MTARQTSSPFRGHLWRVVFAALGALLAHRLAGASAPWMLAGTVLGFQLGRFLGPLFGGALNQLDPPRAPSSPPHEERVTEP